MIRGSVAESRQNLQSGTISLTTIAHVMKKLTLLSLLLAVGLLFGAQRAQAQTQIKIGPRVGYEVDDLQEYSIGADVRITTLRLPIVINPTFDYYLTDGYSLYQVGINGLFQFGFQNQVFTPYAGAGLAITGYSPDEEFDDEGLEELFGDDDVTEYGLNVIGGATFRFGNVEPFVQAHFGVVDADLTTITGGLLFSF